MLEKERALLDFDKVVTTVIPTLNEKEGIGRVLEELQTIGLRNALVVDGYSSDGTVDIARKFGARVISQHGKGKAGAIKTAIDEVDTPYMLIIDGDFSYDASCISRLLFHMNSHDEVIGARVVDGSNMSGLHRFGNRIITKVFNVLMNTDLSDVCSGMYVLRSDSAREIHLASKGFEVEVEIAAQIASSGEVTEVPVNYRRRLGKQKLSTWKHGFKILYSMFKVAKSYNPAVFYTMLGTLLVIPGAFMLLATLMEWVQTGQVITHWFLIGIAMFLVSIQAMGVGVVSLILRRSELRTTRMLKKMLNPARIYET